MMQLVKLEIIVQDMKLKDSSISFEVVVVIINLMHLAELLMDFITTEIGFNLSFQLKPRGTKLGGDACNCLCLELEEALEVDKDKEEFEAEDIEEIEGAVEFEDKVEEDEDPDIDD
ncbi:MAG: hypothetical protein EZS28_018831 [Streblomastix strix]|uniref:Uncharacterized protein n=1 Tax=Streblomastix strix TaxID=222440 RepID=A0A5J4VSP9_9EUKA|nr:MAG: hypothetical protein EZS28_018831 [Streblomastix strix]